jgi:hypothetical protein
MPSNLDGFLQLSDQQIKEAQAAADVSLKLSQAEINWQLADHQALQNVALLLNIKWDEQAHKQLLRMRNIKLRRVKELEARMLRISMWIHDTRYIIDGPQHRDQVRDGWIGFNGLRAFTPTQILVRSFREVPIDPIGCFDNVNWLHFKKTTGEPETVPQYVGIKDAGTLWYWAARNNYYPVVGNAAWNHLAAFVSNISEGCDAEAARLQTKVEKAQAEAQAFMDKDYERLKVDRSK